MAFDSNASIEGHSIAMQPIVSDCQDSRGANCSGGHCQDSTEVDRLGRQRIAAKYIDSNVKKRIESQLTGKHRQDCMLQNRKALQGTQS